MYDTFIDGRTQVQTHCFGRDKKKPLREFHVGDNIKKILKKKGEYDLKIDGKWKKRKFPLTATFTAFYMDPDAMKFAHVKDGVFIGIDNKARFPLFDTWGNKYDTKRSFEWRMLLHVLDHEYVKSLDRLKEKEKNK